MVRHSHFHARLSLRQHSGKVVLKGQFDPGASVLPLPSPLAFIHRPRQLCATPIGRRGHPSKDRGRDWFGPVSGATRRGLPRCAKQACIFSGDCGREPPSCDRGLTGLTSG
jgi:hypothetical protein